MEINKIYQGNCLELMKELPNHSIDCIITDPPYGTTNNKWDNKIDLNIFWKECKRILKDNGIVIIFADEPFTSELIISNLNMFKQRITWDKDKKFGFLNSHKMLMKQTEDIVLFWDKLPTYNPIMVKSKTERGKYKQKDGSKTSNYGKIDVVKRDKDYDWQQSYPSNLLKISSSQKECNSLNNEHPTQKPLEICRWLVKTYSNEGFLILDGFVGSGTIPVACKQLKRNYIGFEINQDYIDISNKRLAQEVLI